MQPASPQQGWLAQGLSSPILRTSFCSDLAKPKVREGLEHAVRILCVPGLQDKSMREAIEVKRV